MCACVGAYRDSYMGACVSVCVGTCLCGSERVFVGACVSVVLVLVCAGARVSVCVRV